MSDVEASKRRKRVLWLGFTLFLCACVLYCPPIRWPLVGLIWQETLYRNLPVSYWRHRIISDSEAREREQGLLGRGGAFFNKITGNAGTDPPIPEGDPAAIPILLELLGDNDPRVRAGAAYALSFRPSTEDVISALLRSMNDQNANVRMESIESMRRLGPVAKVAVPSLFKALNDPDESVRFSAALAVCCVDLEAAKKNERILRQILGIPDDLPGVHYPFPPR